MLLATNERIKRMVELKKKYLNNLLRMMLVLVLAALVVVSFGCEKSSEIDPNEHDVCVMFVNAGRADATLIQIDGISYLIDTGDKNSAASIFAAMSVLDVQNIKAVFLTHTHNDHIGGMEALAKRYKVETLYSARITEKKKDRNSIIEEMAKKLSMPHIELEAGDTVELVPDVEFDVLGPLEYSKDDDNDNSLVLKLSINGKTFLFTGDMQFAEEKTLLEAGVDLSADVLKVGNHGNPDATSKKFASAVSPDIAIISTDTTADNDSANQKVFMALQGADIFVTQDYLYGILATFDENGEIKISDPRP